MKREKMKIVSITTIKNEADIIESFIRYHSHIMDLMIFLNNGSTDNSEYILQQLINEGLPIVMINDKDKYFEPSEKYNLLLDKAMQEYDADIVCPLDCDEFISSDDNNPRILIEKIPKNTVYTIKWRTYVPTKDDDSNILFIPKRIQNIREENIETEYKIIITKELYSKFNARLTIGNHNISFDEKFKDQINYSFNEKLNISHFPLRSLNQTISKVLVNYPNTLSRKEIKEGVSYHYKIMFNKIKKTGTLSMEDVTEFAKQYSIEENKDKVEFEKQISLTHKPMNLKFCDNIKIKYLYDENPMENILDNYIYFAKEINRFKVNNRKNKNQINSLSNQILQEQQKHQNEINNLNTKITQEQQKHQTEIQQQNQKHQNEINNLNTKVSNIKQEYIHQNNKLISNKYCNEKALKIYKKENTYLKNKYLKHTKLSSILAYLYIIFKSKRNDIILNIKLYKSLRNSDCFNLGYYINKYPEIVENDICKKYSPELHYVCYGFDEGKMFNPKCSNFLSKEILLKNIKK